MGVLDFKNENYHLSNIRKALLRRGLKPDTDEEWEIHGPHEGMNYQVYVGYAVPNDDNEKCHILGCNLSWKNCKKHTNFDCVAIYPRAVYHIEEPCDWAEVSPEGRMPVL